VVAAEVVDSLIVMIVVDFLIAEDVEVKKTPDFLMF